MTISTPQTSGGTEIVAFSVLFATASTIVVGLRVLAARLSRRSLRPHDYLAFVATVQDIVLECILSTERTARYFPSDMPSTRSSVLLILASLWLDKIPD